MTRRTWLVGVLGSIVGCREMRRYHSRVKFSLPDEPLSANEPFEVVIDYLDEAPGLDHEVVLLSEPDRAQVDRAAVPPGLRRVTLQAGSPGAYVVEFRENGNMIAHRRIDVR
jgi:hypothetical protein